MEKKQLDTDSKSVRLISYFSQLSTKANNRKEVIDALKTSIFLYIDGFQIKEESEEELEEESKEKS